MLKLQIINLSPCYLKSGLIPSQYPLVVSRKCFVIPGLKYKKQITSICLCFHLNELLRMNIVFHLLLSLLTPQRTFTQWLNLMTLKHLKAFLQFQFLIKILNDKLVLTPKSHLSVLQDLNHILFHLVKGKLKINTKPLCPKLVACFGSF